MRNFLKKKNDAGQVRQALFAMQAVKYIFVIIYPGIDKHIDVTLLNFYSAAQIYIKTTNVLCKYLRSVQLFGSIC